ncbi:hypothetical protein GH714_028244 [Hevea brasiliensis]|uniref:Disease resistance R13L4/SHOC-2-like LRR domain-containing protein n=1 Tax=Hevea brasiliensis TaxID=3981 RepID=A0A6A6N6U3_HEVBR|nr:hypothetical protein GH714_028244 [Hevea brasiliensis]
MPLFSFNRNSDGDLIVLLVLDLWGVIDYLPDEVGDLVQLTYLGLRRTNIEASAYYRVPRGIGTLVNLHTCAGVHVDAGFASELSTLTHLRKLDVRNACEDHASELFAAIFKLENLVLLLLSSENQYLGTPLPELESFSPPPHLQELSLCGRLFEIPNWLASTENLTSLRLLYSNLLENPSSILQFLPKLKRLF